MSLLKCEICLDQVRSDIVQDIRCCEGSYCKGCYSQYVRFSAETTHQIRCPNPYCKAPLKLQLVKNLIPSQVYNEYEWRNLYGEEWDILNDAEENEDAGSCGQLITFCIIILYGCLLAKLLNRTRKVAISVHKLAYNWTKRTLNKKFKISMLKV